jgi:hypothetical protein
MDKGRFEKPKQRRFPYITVVLGVACVVLVILLLQTCQHTPENSSESTVPETTVIKNEGSISIPGYEMLELKANSKQQTIALSNPPQNNCYFEISLYLEDGTLLWKSQLIEPGQATKPLELSMELEKGYYSKSILHYDCFAMNADKTPLNGAEMKVTLWVK